MCLGLFGLTELESFHWASIACLWHLTVMDTARLSLEIWQWFLSYWDESRACGDGSGENPGELVTVVSSLDCWGGRPHWCARWESPCGSAAPASPPVGTAEELGSLHLASFSFLCASAFKKVEEWASRSSYCDFSYLWLSVSISAWKKAGRLDHSCWEAAVLLRPRPPCSLWQAGQSEVWIQTRDGKSSR